MVFWVRAHDLAGDKVITEQYKGILHDSNNDVAVTSLRATISNTASPGTRVQGDLMAETIIQGQSGDQFTHVEKLRDHPF